MPPTPLLCALRPQGGRAASGSVPHRLPVHSEDQSPGARAPVCVQSNPRSPAGLCPPGPAQATSSPDGLGACWAFCLGQFHGALAASITGLRPPAQSVTAWGLGGPEPSWEGSRGPLSCSLIDTSRQRAHFILRQWPSRDDVCARLWGCKREGSGQGSQGRPCGLQGAAWQAELAQG